MNFETHYYNDILIVRIIAPNANADIAGEFKNLLLASFKKPENKKFVIDFSIVEFIDSAFLGAMVYAYRSSVEHKGNILICGLSTDLRFRFEITKLDNIFPIHDTPEDAITQFR